MNKLTVFKLLLATTVLLLYCYSIFQTVVSPLVHPIYFRETEKDDPNQLIDLKDFEFLINPQTLCDACYEDLLLLIIIFTALENNQRRNMIRTSWGKPNECIKIVFLVGTNDNYTLIYDIQSESELYGDILQGNFVDTYRNLTYKHVMGLKWSTHYCTRAEFVVKTDDDLTVYTFILWNKLKRDHWDTTGLACADLKNFTAAKRVYSKWSVSRDEFRDNLYPLYCGGSAVVYSKDVVPRLLKASYEVPYFWIEDVYVTGMLTKKIGVTPRFIEYYWLYFYPNIHVLDTVHEVKSFFNVIGPEGMESMYKIWRARSRNTTSTHKFSKKFDYLHSKMVVLMNQNNFPIGV